MARCTGCSRARSLDARRRDQQAHQAVPTRAARRSAGLEAHQVQHIGDDIGHVARIGFDRASELCARFLIPFTVLCERAARACDHGEWRTQIVRDRRQQGVARRLSDSAATRAASACPRAAPVPMRARADPRKSRADVVVLVSRMRRRFSGKTPRTPRRWRSSLSGTYRAGAAGNESEPMPARLP